MAKRIFKVIGIVLASIFGFTGCVVGVLAIMGKFKKPVVYPQQLVFAEQELMIEDYNNYENDAATGLDLSVDKTETENNQDVLYKGIYSFTLTGLSGGDQDVTEKECTLTITSGSNLIQLCDENGDTSAVEKINNSRYKIKCNEKTYFRLKKISESKFTGSVYGKVVLRARSSNELADTGDNGMTIWIDRAVKELSIDTTKLTEDQLKDEGGVKKITLGLDEAVSFNPEATPENSLNPISREENAGGKIVEYFYFKEHSTMTDWARIDTNDLSNYPFLTFDEETGLKFKASSPEYAGQTYSFRIATFATFKQKVEFLQKVEAGELDTSARTRLQNMVYGQFDITVKSTKITDIGTNRNQIGLSLFEKSNNIILNSNERDNEGYLNLGLYMTGAGANTSLRFDEISFDLRDSQIINWGSGKTALDYTFGRYTESDFSTDESLKLDLSSQTGDSFIDFFVYNTATGAYRLVKTEDTINETGTVTEKAEFKYTATYEQGTTGNDRAFKIVVESMPNLQPGEKLVLGVMVVNSSGEYYLAPMDVDIQEVALDFGFVKGQQFEMIIDYNKTTNRCEVLDFYDVINVNAGSYRGAVLITPQRTNKDYAVSVVENITFTKTGDDTTYVLVGYFEGNQFVNNVRAREGATNSAITKLYVLQLKNTFETNEATNNQDSAEQYINSIIKGDTTGTYTISKTESGTNVILANADYIGDTRVIGVTVKYIINDDINFDNANVKAATSNRTDLIKDETGEKIELIASFDYTIDLTSSTNGMLSNIFNAGGDGFKNYFEVLTYNKAGNLVVNDGWVTIEGVALGEDGKISVTFSINDSANSDAETNAHTYKIKFIYGDVSAESIMIYAKSNKPTDIVLRYKNGENLDEIALADATLDIVIGYDTANNVYNYNYTLKNLNGDTILETESFNLNGENNSNNEVYFYVSPDYMQNLTLSYKIGDKDANLAELSVGDYVLTVSTSYVEKTLNIKVTADEGFDYNKNIISAETTEDTFELNNKDFGVGYKYTSGDTATYLPTLVDISNVICDFAGGTLKLDDSIDNEYKFYTIKTDGSYDQLVLTIKKDESKGWTFVRESYKNTSLTVIVSVKMDTIESAYDFTISFKSAIQINMNKNWGSTIYQGTAVNFYQHNAETSNALFISSSTNASATNLSYTIFKENVNTSEFEEYESFTKEKDGVTYFVFGEVGKYKIEFKANSGDKTSLASFVFEVKLNLFVSKIKSNLTSETDYDLTEAFEFKKYQEKDKDGNYVVYGSDTKKQVIYSDDDKVAATPSGLGLTNTYNNLITLNDSTLSIGAITELGKNKEVTLNLTSNGSKVGDDFVFTIENVWSVETIRTASMVNKDDLRTMFTMINGGTTVAATSVTIDGYTIVDGIVTTIVTENKQVDATFTFVNNGNEYTYTCQITLKPYVPNLVKDKDKYKDNEYKIYSEYNEFDIINSIFDNIYQDETLAGGKITQLYVDGVSDSSVFTRDVNGVGFKTDLPNQSTFITPIGIISGPSVTLKITYRIYYNTEQYYLYEYELTICNTNSVKSEYPFKGNTTTTTTGTNFKVADGKEADMALYNEYVGKKGFTNNGDNLYTFAQGLAFEPVAIGRKLDLNADASLDVRRISVLDKDGKLITDSNKISSVELIAWLSSPTAKNYVDVGAITISGSIITFANISTFDAEASAYFLFKATTTSGNYGFYLVKLYNPNGTNLAGANFKDLQSEYVDGNGEVDIIPSLNVVNKGFNVNLNDSSNLHYYLLSVKTGANTSTGAFETSGVEELKDLPQYKELTLDNGEFKISYNGFLQVKVGILYVNGTQVMYLGSYTTNITSTAGLNIYDETTKEGVLHQTSTLGHYTATINDLNQLSITTDDATAEIVKVTLPNNSKFEFNQGKIQLKVKKNDTTTTKDIISLTGGNVCASTYIPEKLLFEVEYKLSNGTTIYVEFTFDAVTVDAMSDAKIGEFDTINKTGFDTGLDLTSRLGNYAGAVYYDELNTDGTIVEAKHTELTVGNRQIDYSGVQSTQTQIVRVQLTLNELLDLETGSAAVRTFSVTIVPAYYIVNTNSASNPLNATANRVYDSVIGNKVKVDQVGDRNSKFYTYSIGENITLYLGTGASLEITSEFYNYIVKSATTNGQTTYSLLSDNNDKLEVEGSQTLNFVHMPTSKVISLAVKFKNESGYYKEENGSDKAIELYINLMPTYSNFKANYTVVGSNHDNFKTGKNQENILAYLLNDVTGTDNGITNVRRMSLVTTQKEKDEYVLNNDFDAVAMGFMNADNPNHIVLNTGAAISIVANGGDYDITFGTVSIDTASYISFTNAAGLLGEQYQLYVLAADEKLIYQPEGDEQQYYLENHSTWGETSQFASVIITDTSADSNYEYTSSQNRIARISDNNNDVLKFGNIKYDGADAKVEEKDGVYTITAGSYTIKLWRSASCDILFAISRANGQVASQITITMDIYTNSGKICSGFTLNIYNYSIVETETEWYATEQIKLEDLFDIKDQNNQKPTELKYSLMTDGSSYYSVGGDKVVKIESETNDLFEYDETTSSLITYQVPANVTLTAYVKITKGNVIVAVVRRVVTIKCNLQFRLDGKEAASGSPLTSTYDMNGEVTETSSNGNKFNLNALNLKNGYSVEENGISQNFGKLTLNYAKAPYTQITMGTDNTDIHISQILINGEEVASKDFSKYVTYDPSDFTITFVRDFSGVVTISLGYETNCGVYRQYWDMTVNGLANIAYTATPMTIKDDNGSSFKSGDTVLIAGAQIGKNPALNVSKSNNFANIETNERQISIDTSVEYVVLTTDKQSSISMDYLNSADTWKTANSVQGITSLEVEIPLPTVPQSTPYEPVNYYVIFKIEYGYVVDGENNLVNTMPYYAIYQVVNTATVTLNANASTDINVDTNMAVGETSNYFYISDDSRLNLFYYQETYDSYTISYGGLSDNKPKFIVDGTTYTAEIVTDSNSTGANWFNGSVLQLTKDDGTTYKFDYSTSEPTLKIGDNTIERTSVKTVGNTMYDCDYANLLRFKAFIDNFSRITINDADFTTLHSDDNGTFYIILTEGKKGDNNVILFENSASTQLKLFTKDSTEAMFETDISLKGNNSITAKGTLSLSQIFQNGGYGTDYTIVGIAETTDKIGTNWVNKAEEVISTTEVSSFEIGKTTETNGTEYTIYSVKFQGSGKKGLYTVSEECYVLIGASEIYAVDYRSKGESNCFRVKYKEGSASSIDLKDALKCYKNGSDGTLAATPVTLTNASTIITKTDEELIEYKQEHPNATTLDIDVNLTYASGTITAKVKFVLPSSVPSQSENG